MFYLAQNPVREVAHIYIYIYIYLQAQAIEYGILRTSIPVDLKPKSQSLLKDGLE